VSTFNFDNTAKIIIGLQSIEGCHLSSPPVLNGFRVTQALVLCVCFVNHCLSFCTFSFGHCFVCSTSIYTDSDYPFGTMYLQTLLSQTPQYFIYYFGQLEMSVLLIINLTSNDIPFGVMP
jgi:hypothetical protein